MKTKIIAGILLVSLAAGGTIFALNRNTDQPVQDTEPTATTDKQPVKEEPKEKPAAQAPTPPATPAPAPEPEPTLASNTCSNPRYTIPMNPTDAHDGITLKGFYLTGATWNVDGYNVEQTVYICDYNNWFAIAKMSNQNGDGAVKTYPNVHKDYPNGTKISSFSKITSSFAHTAPKVGIYNFAYDIWLNGIADNGSTELMIWTDNFGQHPCGSSPINVNLSGRSWKAYKCGKYIAFKATSNFTSGTVDILAIMKYIIGKGWIPANSTVGQIDYGVEIVSTNNKNARFEINNFTLETVQN